MKSLLSILTAIIVLFVSTGFTVSKHFCANEIKSVSYFFKVKECNHAESPTEKVCHKKESQKKCCSKKKAVKKDDCCKTTFDSYQLNLDYVKVEAKPEINKQQFEFITAFVYSFVSVINFKTHSKTFTEYQPPKLYRDIPVLIQSFLI